MSKRIRPKKYLLTQKKRNELAKYMAGEQGARKTAEAMGTTTQSLYCIVTATMRHSAMKGRIDFKQLITQY